MIYAKPGTPESVISFKSRYENFIGGEWVAPVKGEYFNNITPVTGEVICEIPRSGEADIELALDAAHKAREAWGKTSVQDRSNILLKIADRIEANLEKLAVAETWDNGKAVRETLTTSAILLVVCVLRKAPWVRLMKTQWPIISMNLSVLSVKLFRGTSHC